MQRYPPPFWVYDFSKLDKDIKKKLYLTLYSITEWLDSLPNIVIVINIPSTTPYFLFKDIKKKYAMKQYGLTTSFLDKMNLVLYQMKIHVVDNGLDNYD